MIARQQPLYKKRKPVDWRRYAGHVRRAEVKLARRRHPFVATVIGSLVLAVAGALLAQTVGLSVAAGLRDLGGSIVSALPQSQDSEIVLGETPVTVSTAPILDTLPEFVKSSDLIFDGRIPAFAVKRESVISLALDGKQVTTLAVAPDGRFGGVTLQLHDGPNVIEATLVEGTSEIAATSHTVVVDRKAPELKILRPTADEEIAGTEVIVEGMTEAAADVSVNDRALRPNPDGTFTERVLATPGPLRLVIVAKDKAGNETKTEIAVTVSEAQAPTQAGLILAMSLDRTWVKPGETVIAEIHALRDGQLLADLAVTVQVGVFTIGTYRTDGNGRISLGFAAPDREIENIAVLAVASSTSARATLTVSKSPQPSSTQ